MTSTLTETNGTAPTPLPPRMVPKRGPALIVIGIVATITVGGGLLAVLGQAPKVGGGALASPPGLNLRADHAKNAMAQIVVADEPPSDIIAALTVPAGAALAAHTAPSASSGLYDGSITLSVPATKAKSVAFYKYELANDGWHISETVAGANDATDIYATHDSIDGFTWEVEVAVTARSGAITPALDGGGTSSQTSSVTIRLIERDDED